MPIDKIPILAEDYPLFDWDDYPLSYYALGEGELVSGFQKETWNAIIDKTLAALNAAGLSWDTKYTTFSGARVTEAYGALTADMFNSVRHNIDHPAPVGWGWANNPNLRGYVGREDFKGYGEYGMDCDLFYAEYLLEMVRRLNLLLSIMKGTANLKEMAAPIMSQTQSVHGLLALPSAAMKFREPSRSLYICGLQANPATQLAYKKNSLSLISAEARKYKSAPLFFDEIVYSLQKSKMQMPFATVLGKYHENILSAYKAEMDVFNAFYLGYGWGKAMTSTKTTLSAPSPFPIIGESISEAVISATPKVFEPKPMGSGIISKTETAAVITKPTATRMEVKEMSKASHMVTFGRIRPRRFAQGTLSKTTHIAILESAWYTPIWVNGKLYIRQAYETTQTDAILEVT